jgi:outer membrane murein-binding lipoprotein Lpp
MAQASDDSTFPHLTSKKATEIVTIIEEANLGQLGGAVEQANALFGQLAENLKTAEEGVDVAVHDADRAEATVALWAERRAVSTAVASLIDGMHALLARTAGTLRLIDQVLASVG